MINTTRMPMHRVVITGMGVVTPFGEGVAVMMKGLLDRKSCVKRMEGWEGINGLRSFIAAPVGSVDEKRIPRQKRRTMGRMAIFSVLAADEAIRAAGLDSSKLDLDRAGVIAGSTMGSANNINEFFESYQAKKDISDISPMLFFKSMSNTAAINVAQYLGWRGYLLATSAACASGLQAIGAGYHALKMGIQDVIVCGGTEELHSSVTGVFDLLFATSTNYNDNPEKSPRPFDSKRDGIVCGEGSGMMVLETLEHASARGANILAEIIGYTTCGGGDHVSQSSREAVSYCMTASLKDAGLGRDDIDYISAHGTATIQGDAAEAEAIAGIFGDQVPVSSLKGHFGHTLGASGAIELVATVGMMQDGIIHPGINLDSVASDCGGVNFIQEPFRREVRTVMKNCFAFGGVNATLICRKI